MMKNTYTKNKLVGNDAPCWIYTDDDPSEYTIEGYEIEGDVTIACVTHKKTKEKTYALQICDCYTEISAALYRHIAQKSKRNE